MRRLICVVVIAACGSSGKRPPPEPVFQDPAWAAGYERRAGEGCECADADCLNKAHDELTALETAHGGMDEAPPGVHKAHGKFDQCWRDGTRDLSRDLEHAAQSTCTCTTADCLRLAKIELTGLAGGKYHETFDADVQAEPRAVAAMLRIADCVKKVTMPAKDAMALFERTTDSLCACSDMACASAVMKERDTALTKFLDVEATIDLDKVGDLRAKFCKCVEKVAVNEIKGASPAPALTSVSVSMGCN